MVSETLSCFFPFPNQPPGGDHGHGCRDVYFLNLN